MYNRHRHQQADDVVVHGHQQAEDVVAHGCGAVNLTYACVVARRYNSCTESCHYNVIATH